MAFFGGGGASASNMVGATSSAAGTAGLVPQPAAGDEDKQLLGSGTFVQTAPFQLTNYTSGLFAFHVINCFGGFERNSVTLTADEIYFSPVFINFPFTFDRILYSNRTSQQSNFKFGLYTHDRSAGLPKTLLVESANVATITGSATTEVTVNSTFLKPDVYWICLVSASDIPSTYRIADDSKIRTGSLLIGGNDTANLAGWAGSSVQGISVETIKYAFSYSGSEALPTTLSAGSFSIANLRAPWLAIRKS